jgi:hypothetical protein
VRGVGEGLAIGIVRVQSRDLLVAVDLAPHVHEDSCHVLEAPKEVVRPLEWLRGVARVSTESGHPRLPGCVGGDARRGVRLALRGYGDGGLRRCVGEKHIGTVSVDQLARDLAGALGITLGILDKDLDGVGLAAGLDRVVLEPCRHRVGDPLVALAECGQWSGQRCDEADLDGVGGRSARRAPGAGSSRRDSGGRCRARGAGRGRVQVATRGCQQTCGRDNGDASQRSNHSHVHSVQLLCGPHQTGSPRSVFRQVVPES